MPLPTDNGIYRGTKLPLRQRLSEQWSPINGFTSSAEWMGFGEDEMRALANQYANSGIAYELESHQGAFTLKGTDSSGAITIDTWEILVQDEIVSSLKNPLNILAVPADDLLIIKYMSARNWDMASAILAIDQELGLVVTWSFNSAAERLLQRMQEGSEGYFDYRYILRHTTNVSNRWDVNVSDENVGRIYTTSQLLSEVEDGTSWIYPLPDRLSYKITTLAADFISRYGTLSDYQWGWLKSGSPENSAANNRVNIVTEYKFYNWSTDEYDTL